MNYKNSLDEKERLKLRESHVCIVGCGGLGGYIAEMLIRLGVGTITAVDGDCFNESNLNRQLYCTLSSIGKLKSEAVRSRAEDINADIRVIALSEFLTADNAVSILEGCDLVIDALDSIEARHVLHNACSLLSINMVYGAIGPWSVQYGVIPPNSELFSKLSAASEYHGDTVLSFVPALCASYQVCEAVKLLTGNGSELMGKLCSIDLLSGEQTVIEI